MKKTVQSVQSNEDENENQNETPFSYDEVLEHIGQLGPYQLRSFLVLLMPCFFFGLTIMSYIFTAGIPRYRCRVNGCDPLDIADTELVPHWLNHTVPWGESVPKLLRQCRRFNETWSDVDQCHTRTIDHNSAQLIKCEDGWIYDLSNFHSSIVTEFDLTCDDEWKHTLGNTLFLVGMLVGAVTMGNLADIIGRRKTFLMIWFNLAVCSTACAFATEFWTFAVLRFFCGIFDIGFFLAAFIWGVESVGPKYRILSGYILTGITSVGSILLGLTAYYIRDWRTLQLVISVPMFPILAITYFLPESTRWLLSQNRYNEAHQLILDAAKFNDRTVPHHIMDKFQAQSLSHSIRKDNEKSSENLISIFRSPVMCRRIIILFAAWIGTNMGYYGLTFSATNLSGDMYLNYVLSMIVEPPAKIISVMVRNLLGRRTLFCSGLIISGCFCLITGFVPSDPTYIRMVTSLLGKFFVSCSLGLIYFYTAELFPTSTRSSAVGLCSTMSKFGSFAAPALAALGRNGSQTGPFVIFAIVNIIIGFLCMLLPETKDTLLPATIEDAEKIGSKK